MTGRTARADGKARLARGAAPSSESPPIDRAEIAEMVRAVVVTLKGDLSPADLALYHELEDLARFIQNTRSEIAALRPDEISEKHLPSAADELDAIIGATEEATSVILDSVEQIEVIAQKIAGDHGAKAAELVTRIYEACNFQDITGQRITKVVKTLKHIEAKIDALIGAFGDEIEREKARARAESRQAAGPNAVPSERDLLNGPQLPGTGNSQADIDALFNTKR